jgi:aerobic C4-dicarboxylate transport protein
MKHLRKLYIQVLIGVFLGIIVGYFFPSLGIVGKSIGEIYINLIKMLIAPLIFFTITTGIAGTGNLKKAGRIGGKALIYFEIVSTIALLLGILVANIVKPGMGVPQDTTNATTSIAKVSKEINWAEFFMHMIPSNVVDSFAKGDILQVLVFSVLFGIALSKLGPTGKSITLNFEKINQVLFTVLNMITVLSPIAAFGGMLSTVGGKNGFAMLFVLGKFMMTFYLTCVFFIFVILGLIMRFYKMNIFKLLSYVKEEILIVFGSSSSESVLPNIMSKLEKAGCSSTVVGLVVPTGYSFNLDGTTIYLGMSVLFITQALGIDLDVMQQFTVVGILLLTSKGAGGITGSGLIILKSSLDSMKFIPEKAQSQFLPLLIGIDRLMSLGRALTNVIGNTVACVVIAKNENLIDEAIYKAVVENTEELMVPVRENNI